MKFGVQKKKIHMYQKSARYSKVDCNMDTCNVLVSWILQYA